MSSGPVQFAIDGSIAIVTIDRPAVKNAIDRTAAVAIEAALDRAEALDEVAVIVITGAGGVFSAGMDLKAFDASGERPTSPTRGAFGIVQLPPTKPIVAAVEGPCLGGGFEIALACDLIVAAEEASFGLPEVTRGLVAAAGGLIRLPRRVPRGVAMELILAGEQLSARRAYALGLVARVAPPGAALAAALELAARIAVAAPLAVRASKRVIRAAEPLGEGLAFAAQLSTVTEVRESEDAREGARAFAEKRRPKWRGR